MNLSPANIATINGGTYDSTVDCAFTTSSGNQVGQCAFENKTDIARQNESIAAAFQRTRQDAAAGDDAFSG